MAVEPTSKAIRQEFVEFFTSRGHRFVPSTPVVPLDDPTLMFINAGMNQFKDIFLGTRKPEYLRAANSQKCIRVSGKHNDLEEVGKDGYHHTFFEMLGNWSFGDYFKEEAIQWAWELLVDKWGLDADRLWVAVFSGDKKDGLGRDDEAVAVWQKQIGLPGERILEFGKKDNFWEMGEVGPCGPCSEIHIDLGEGSCPGTHRGPCGVNVEDKGGKCSRFLELWNLVFIQFNRDQEGKLHDLPAKHVDTGLGLERIVRVLGDKRSNYDTDLFTDIFAATEKLTSKQYNSEANGPVEVAFRVIADHIRALVFAIADGVLPSNEGRGYVLRRILRRAARYGRKLDMHKPFICRLVEPVVNIMGDAFPETATKAEFIEEVIHSEEESFGRTLDRGIEIFQEAAGIAKEKNQPISGQDTFKLHDTYGFPVDLTNLMAQEQGLHVDIAGFEKLMEKARQKARAASKTATMVAVEANLPETIDTLKYEGLSTTAKILGWVEQAKFLEQGELPKETEVGLVTDRTCFYVEQGGQVGDAGIIETDTGCFRVSDTQLAAGGLVHVGQLESGHISVGQEAKLQVGAGRLATARNHTATHLLHWALQEVIGEHARQRGSRVAPESLRFDFDHLKALTKDQISAVERLVNEKVWQDLALTTTEMPLEQAKKIDNLRAFFGDKYGEQVRLVQMEGGFSRELCGGTHLDRTGQIGLFKIISEESVAKGIRRITAATAEKAYERVISLENTVAQVSKLLKSSPDQLTERIKALQNQLKELQNRLASGASQSVKSFRDELAAKAQLIGSTAIVVAEAPPQQGPDWMRATADWLRKELTSVAMMLATKTGGKVLLTAALSKDLVDRGLSASEWIESAAKVVGGKGGGKPALAQGGGPSAENISLALEQAHRDIKARLGEIKEKTS